MKKLIILALAVMPACHNTEKVPAEVQFVRDEAARFQQYIQLGNRLKEDQAAINSFTKMWNDSVCKPRKQTLAALGDHVGCTTPEEKKPEEKK
jgi:hypothetical protein